MDQQDPRVDILAEWLAESPWDRMTELFQDAHRAAAREALAKLDAARPASPAPEHATPDETWLEQQVRKAACTKPEEPIEAAVERLLHMNIGLARWCRWPGCGRSYDAMNGPVGDPGWRVHRHGSDILLCPEHHASGHHPSWRWPDPEDITVQEYRCGCGLTELRDRAPFSAFEDWWTAHVDSLAAFPAPAAPDRGEARYRAADVAAIRAALNGAEGRCRFHGDEFGRSLGWERNGEPRCDSCKQPYRVRRARSVVDRDRITGTTGEGQ